MIYHLLEKPEWESRQKGDQPVAAPGPDGFVHCCDEGQLATVRAAYFSDGVAVVALRIDPTRLAFETRYEPGAGGEAERFPHVYGVIDFSTIDGVVDI